MIEARSFGAIAMIARWRPVHIGQAVVLHALCDAATHAKIGIGSANRYNVRNPFTFDETADMIRLVLSARDNYEIVRVDDLDDGPRWREKVLGLFGPLDMFVTDNPYVSSLLRDDYALMRPVALVPPERRVRVDGTMVRRLLAQGGDWQSLVPPEVARYITDHGLDARFRREFGLQALAMDTLTNDTASGSDAQQ
jgi:nicotinamide-nucleotide adenylyltransferase